MGDCTLFEKMKQNVGAIAGVVCDSVREAVLEDEKALAVKTAEEEHEYCSQCAAAAMVEAKVADGKIKELLMKYFRLGEKEAASALGEGHLMAERKALKKAGASNKKKAHRATD